MQSEFFKCSSIVKEYTRNFHSDGNLAHSGTSMTRVLGRSTLRCAASAESDSGRRSRFGEEEAVSPPTKTSAPNMILLHSGPLLVTSLPVGVQSTAMSVSIRLWVCLSVCLSARISPNTSPKFNVVLPLAVDQLSPDDNTIRHVTTNWSFFR